MMGFPLRPQHWLNFLLIHSCQNELMAKPHTHKPKSPKRVVEERVNRVITLMSQGATNREIRAFVMREWDLSHPQAQRYLRKANEAIIEECNQDRHLFASRLIHGLQHIQREAIEVGDLKAANAAIAQLAKIARITT